MEKNSLQVVFCNGMRPLFQDIRSLLYINRLSKVEEAMISSDKGQMTSLWAQ